jgi:RNA-directed DNA polymerase
MLLTLVRDYDFFSDTPLYMKRYHRLRQRLVLIQRIYKREAKEMWKKLKALAPTKTKDEHEL